MFGRCAFPLLELLASVLISDIASIAFKTKRRPPVKNSNSACRAFCACSAEILLPESLGPPR